MTTSYGPDGTAIAGLTALTFPIEPLNIAEDFRVLSSSPGDVVLADVSTPLSQLATVRLSVSEKANMYAGTSIDASGFLPNKKGIEGRVEVREIWSITDATDTTYQKFAPARATIAFSVPQAVVTSNDVIHLLTRAIAALAQENTDTIGDGLADMLHGIVGKD